MILRNYGGREKASRNYFCNFKDINLCPLLEFSHNTSSTNQTIQIDWMNHQQSYLVIGSKTLYFYHLFTSIFIYFLRTHKIGVDRLQMIQTMWLNHFISKSPIWYFFSTTIKIIKPIAAKILIMRPIMLIARFEEAFPCYSSHKLLIQYDSTLNLRPVIVL